MKTNPILKLCSPLRALLLAMAGSLGFTGNARATAIGMSELSFFNLRITPASGTVERISDWYLSTYAEASGSSDFHEGFVSVAPASVDGNFTHADAQAAAPDPPSLNGNGRAHSEGEIPGQITASDYALARATTSVAFKVTGGSGSVLVDYAVDISGFLEVRTDQYGVLAETETIFGLEQNKDLLLSFYEILSIGPNQALFDSFSTTLSTQQTLEFDTTYFLYLEGDSETRLVNSRTHPTPESGTTLGLLFLSILSLAGLHRCLTRRRAPLAGRKTRVLEGHSPLVPLGLALIGGLYSATVSEGKYKGANWPSVARYCNCGIANDVSTFSSLSLTEGNLMQDYATAMVKNATGVTLDMTLTYNSYDADGSRSQVDTVLGIGWTHSYNIFLFSQGGRLFRYDGQGGITKFDVGSGATLGSMSGYFETLTRNTDGSYTIAGKHGTTWNFASIPGTPFMVDGPVYRLTSIVDRNNKTTTLTYVAGNLDTITNSWGQAIYLTHNAQNKLASIQDDLGRTHTLQYNASGRNLLVIEDPLGKLTRYSYNVMNQITRKVDKDKRVFNYLYANLKPVGVKDGAGATLFSLSNPVNWAVDGTSVAFSKTLDFIPSTTTKTDGRGNLWQYDYNEFGYITRVVAPDGATQSYTFDPVTLQVSEETDANLAVTKYQYDGLGNRISVIDALDHETAMTYEPVFSMMTSMTDANGNSTAYKYDARGNRIREIDALLQTREWTYDSRGNVLTVKDKRGFVTHYEYDAFGNLVKITAPAPLNYVTTMTYDAVGNLLSRTDGNNHSTTYTYDALNRLITETDALLPVHGMTRYAYDGEGNRRKVTDANGHATSYKYDLRRRLQSTTDALKQTVTQIYDANDNRITVTDKNNHTTHFDYDVQNRLLSITDAIGGVSSMTYDGVGNKLTETDRNGHTTLYSYDPLNRVKSMTDAENFTTLYEYDATGAPGCCGGATGTEGTSRIVKLTDGNDKVTYFAYDPLYRQLLVVRKEGDTDPIIDDSDAVTESIYDSDNNRTALSQRISATESLTATYDYDELNRLISETNPAGDITEYNYDPVGNRVSLSAPNGNVTLYAYDEKDRLIQMDDSVGRVGSYTYDFVGNRLSSTDGNNHTTAFRYDAINRLIRVADPMGRATRTVYDPTGNVIQVIDREGHITRHTYDDLDRRITTTDALNNLTQFAYDAVGNLNQITDAKIHSTHYFYDAVNRLIQEQYPDSTPNTRTYTYDAVNLLTRKDQKGQTTTYAYNDLYFLLQRAYPVSAADNFTYDLSGRMLSAERDGWLVTFKYDGANRVTETTQGGRTLSYAYDIPSRTRLVTYPGGRQILETIDPRGRLSTIDDGAAPPPIARYTYDLANRVTSRAYRNGVAATYAYNANDWNLSLEHKLGATRIAGFAYDYDKEGNKKFEEKRHDPADSESYQYDGIYRLIDYKVGTLVGSLVTAPVTQTGYDLDPVGNWNSRTTDAVVQTRVHNSANELTKIDASSLLYDDNGNLQKDSVYSYAYDEENRLGRVIRNADSAIVGEYHYDAFGRRIRKISNPAGVATTTNYFQDANRIVEDQDGFGVTQATYTYGNYIDEVLTLDRGGQTFYFHQNNLWSVAAITDAAASTIERYAYDAYGFATVMTGAGALVPPNLWSIPQSAVGNPYLFTGRHLDEESGLYFYRARFYDTAKGRFIQRDPLIYAGGINHYRYVANRPTAATDPSGLFAVTGDIKVWLQYADKGPWTLQKFKLSDASLEIHARATLKADALPTDEQGCRYLNLITKGTMEVEKGLKLGDKEQLNPTWGWKKEGDDACQARLGGNCVPGGACVQCAKVTFKVELMEKLGKWEDYGSNAVGFVVSTASEAPYKPISMAATTIQTLDQITGGNIRPELTTISPSITLVVCADGKTCCHIDNAPQGETEWSSSWYNLSPFRNAGIYYRYKTVSSCE